MLSFLGRARTGVLVLSCTWVVTACAEDGESLRVPAPDAAEFESVVYPVLMRDCGFPECHGNPARFFRVYGPGRTRLDPSTPPFAAVTDAELRQSYERARSMLATSGDLEDAPLLRKPLATTSEGTGHEGTDTWGRDVYASPADPSFQAILAWAREAIAQPAQQPAQQGTP